MTTRKKLIRAMIVLAALLYIAMVSAWWFEGNANFERQEMDTSQ